MVTHSFYTVAPQSASASTTLILLSADAYQTKKGLSSRDESILASVQFGAKIGEIALVFDDIGALQRVYIGSDRGSDHIALAAVVMKLPVGTYHSATPLSDRALVMWALAQYRYNVFRKVRTMPRILVLPADKSFAITAEADAIFLVRDLINAPGNIMGPEGIAQVVDTLAKTHHAHVQQWVGDELLEDNFPAIHAVGRASALVPRLLMLTWGDESHPRVTLVGKGVCFDSGGLDLKNAAGMRLMKKDMGGAAQVLGLAQWLMTMQVPIRLQVLIPAVENAVGPDAYRPGDVLTMRNGMTVEIDNTDAEGRLILADALVKACECSPDLLIDFATLTGAARIAVGTEISAMFCNDDALATEIGDWGAHVADPIWRMPLHQGYQSLFESSIADLANASASPYAGAITAALFLQHFVQQGIPWVHFDIMAWNVSTKPGKPEGGEAMAILAVGHYLFNRYG
jgi:leucyl aminopeptidase